MPQEITTDFNFYRLRKMIEEGLKESDSYKANLGENSMNNLDIKAIFDIETEYFEMEDKIGEYAENFWKFLDEINSPSPFLELIQEVHLSLIKLIEGIEEHFQKLRRNPKAIRLYSYYIKIFQFDKKQSEEMLKRMKKFKEIALAFRQEDKMFDDTSLLFDDHTTLFQIGANLDNLGKILVANKGASMMTGYSLRELHAMNIRQILPKEFSKNHNTYMLNAYRTG